MLALTPGVGDIDIVVASELLEAGRTVANGFVTPERTLLIASLSRFYAIDEKIAMGDGRFDQDKLIKVDQGECARRLLFDMEALAKESGSMINAVMLGAIAGCGQLPMTSRAVRSGDPRRRQVGRQQSARLPRRLRRRRARRRSRRNPPRRSATPRSRPNCSSTRSAYSMPALAQPTAIEGVRRLIAYQDVAYAQLYLDRLRADRRRRRSRRRARQDC